jgi:uncharacterized Zn-finger protein
MDKPTDSEHVQAAGYQGGDKMNAPAINRKQRRQAQIRTPEPVKESEPVARVKFVPNQCKCCEAMRPKDKDYSRVYCTVGSIRYVKCGYCGHTWKQRG